MRTTKILLGGALLALAVPLAAHDFWLQPERFSVAVDTPVDLTLLVGHGTFRQRWGVPPDRIVKFLDIGASGSVDARALVHSDSGDTDATLRFATPGMHIVVIETRHAESRLPAIRFNDYLKVEGLTPAIARRAASGTGNTEGREIYSRRAKTLIQVGNRNTPQPHVTRPVGLKLEIVPQKSPYALAPGEKLPLQVLYDGRPLAGATVKLNNLDFDAKPIAVRLTGRDGRVMLAVPQRGRWQVNVIWTTAIKGNPIADYDTTFSSLTFGFDPAAGQAAP